MQFLKLPINYLYVTAHYNKRTRNSDQWAVALCVFKNLENNTKKNDKKSKIRELA